MHSIGKSMELERERERENKMLLKNLRKKTLAWWISWILPVLLSIRKRNVSNEGSAALGDEPHVTPFTHSAPKGWQPQCCSLAFLLLQLFILWIKLKKKKKKLFQSTFSSQGWVPNWSQLSLTPCSVSSASKLGETPAVTHVQPEKLSSSSTNPSYSPLNRKAAVTLAKLQDKPWQHVWAPGLRGLLKPCPPTRAQRGAQRDSGQGITPTASQQANPHSTHIIKYETAKGAKPLIKCQKYRKYWQHFIWLIL